MSSDFRQALTKKRGQAPRPIRTAVAPAAAVAGRISGRRSEQLRRWSLERCRLVLRADIRWIPMPITGVKVTFSFPYLSEYLPAIGPWNNKLQPKFNKR